MTQLSKIRWTAALAALLILSLGAGSAGPQSSAQANSSDRVTYAPALAERARPPRIPNDVELMRDVAFGKGGDRPLKLNILRPKNPPNRPMPVVVFVHGGGWRAGNKNVGIPRLVRLAQKGYFTVSIDYRLSGEAVFPAQIEDCKCAVRWLRAHAKEYDLDPDRIGVWGTSAGGHLVALLGTSGGAKELEGKGGWEKYSSRVQAVVDCFGPTDLLKIMADAGRSKVQGRREFGSGKNPVALLIGGPIEENKDKAAEASPVTYVSKDDPPFLILHGDQDPLVPLVQSERFCEALKKAGVEAELHVVKGAGHGFARLGEVSHMIRNFFDEHLKVR